MSGKIPVTALPGTSYFDSTESFAMIRGGNARGACGRLDPCGFPSVS